MQFMSKIDLSEYIYRAEYKYKITGEHINAKAWLPEEQEEKQKIGMELIAEAVRGNSPVTTSTIHEYLYSKGFDYSETPMITILGQQKKMFDIDKNYDIVEIKK